MLSPDDQHRHLRVSQNFARFANEKHSGEPVRPCDVIKIKSQRSPAPLSILRHTDGRGFAYGGARNPRIAGSLAHKPR